MGPVTEGAYNFKWTLEEASWNNYADYGKNYSSGDLRLGIENQDGNVSFHWIICCCCRNRQSFSLERMPLLAKWRENSPPPPELHTHPILLPPWAIWGTSPINLILSYHRSILRIVKAGTILKKSLPNQNWGALETEGPMFTPHWSSFT